MSMSYYTSIEQGRARNVSSDVLRSISRALGLDSFQEAHLMDLASLHSRRPALRPTRRTETVDPHLVALMNALPMVPVLISGRTGDILAWNPLGHAVFTPFLHPDSINDRGNRPNTARIVFLDPGSRSFFVNWEQKARAVVAHLRLSAGHDPNDLGLASLIGELCMHSPEFARLWVNGNDVRPCGLMELNLNHPTVGPLTVIQQALTRSETHGQNLIIGTVGTDCVSQAALEMLIQLNDESAHRNDLPPSSPTNPPKPVKVRDDLAAGQN
jgi:hypothetical protein